MSIHDLGSCCIAKCVLSFFVRFEGVRGFYKGLVPNILR